MVCAHIFNRGRSSSRKVQCLMSRVSSVLLAVSYWRTSCHCLCPHPFEPGRQAKSSSSCEAHMATVKVLPKGRTKQDRKQLRQALGTLRALTVAPKTRVRYDKALQAFHFYAKCMKQRIPEDALALDRLFSLYMEHLWQEGDSLSLATAGLSGLQYLRPSLRGSGPLMEIG